MTLLTRLSFNLLLPLLLFVGAYQLFFTLGKGVLEQLPLQVTALGLAALLAILPPLGFRSIVRSQIKEGFALLNGGRIVVPDEIGISDVLGGKITAWKLFQQHLDTEICLQGKGQLVYVKLGLNFTIPADQNGKEFVAHYKTNMTIFEAWVQRTIFLVSARDTELANDLATNALLNEEDEVILRKVLLNALEAQSFKRVNLPSDTSGLNVKRKVRVRKQPTTTQPGTF